VSSGGYDRAKEADKALTKIAKNLDKNVSWSKATAKDLKDDYSPAQLGVLLDGLKDQRQEQAQAKFDKAKNSLDANSAARQVEEAFDQKIGRVAKALGEKQSQIFVRLPLQPKLDMLNMASKQEKQKAISKMSVDQLKAANDYYKAMGDEARQRGERIGRDGSPFLSVQKDLVNAFLQKQDLNEKYSIEALAKMTPGAVEEQLVELKKAERQALIRDIKKRADDAVDMFGFGTSQAYLDKFAVYNKALENLEKGNNQLGALQHIDDMDKAGDLDRQILDMADSFYNQREDVQKIFLRTHTTEDLKTLMDGLDRYIGKNTGSNSPTLQARGIIGQEYRSRKLDSDPIYRTQDADKQRWEAAKEKANGLTTKGMVDELRRLGNDYASYDATEDTKVALLPPEVRQSYYDLKDRKAQLKEELDKAQKAGDSTYDEEQRVIAAQRMLDKIENLSSQELRDLWAIKFYQDETKNTVGGQATEKALALLATKDLSTLSSEQRSLYEELTTQKDGFIQTQKTDLETKLTNDFKDTYDKLALYYEKVKGEQGKRAADQKDFSEYKVDPGNLSEKLPPPIKLKPWCKLLKMEILRVG